jgi:hypothetical protein
LKSMKSPLAKRRRQGTDETPRKKSCLAATKPAPAARPNEPPAGRKPAPPAGLDVADLPETEKKPAAVASPETGASAWAAKKKPATADARKLSALVGRPKTSKPPAKAKKRAESPSTKEKAVAPVVSPHGEKIKAADTEELEWKRVKLEKVLLNRQKLKGQDEWMNDKIWKLSMEHIDKIDKQLLDSIIVQ